MAVSVPFARPAVGEAEAAAASAAVLSGWLTTGPATARFERAFAEAVGAEAALGVSSGTAAMKIGLSVLGVGPGDAVFTTAFTFCSTLHVIEDTGAVPVVVDIQPDTLNLDPEALRAAVEAVVSDGRLRPRAVLPVHYGGHPCDLTRILAIAREYGMSVLEDAAHALPAYHDGVPIGATDGDVPRLVAFSFYATKNLTTGEGGMLTGPARLVDEARPWALHGMTRDAWRRYETGSWRYDVVLPGHKANMTDVAASIGLVQLERLPELQAQRQRIVDRYLAELDASRLELPVERPGYRSAWHLFPVRLRGAGPDERQAFIDVLTREGIGTSVHFIPVYQLSYYAKRYGWEPENFPVTDDSAGRLVTLPLFPSLTDDEVDAVVAACRAALR